MTNPSVKSRFAISATANLIRGGISFLTTVFIARAFGPEQYGNIVFLLGSFAAVRSLLDMGTGSAFYTFISKKPQAFAFYVSYAIWQLVQFLLPFLIIAFIFPQSWLDTIWVGQERSLILLAFAATFFQQLLWPTMTHIGESRRLTQRVQVLNISISVANLFLIFGAWALEILTVPLLFWILLTQYLFGLLFAVKVLSVFEVGKEPLNIRSMLREYLAYCLPLFVSYWLAFVSEFADRWLLQNFGGAEEQAFFMLGHRFAAIGLLATTSMLNIFWKEIAEAQEKQNLDRLRTLYQKISRFLYTTSAVICGLLIPWANEIVAKTLGPSYISGSSVLAIMFIFPLHATLGQVNLTFLLSTGKTKISMIIGSIFMFVSIPITYFVQAPQNALIPGFDLGAFGIAWKVVILNIITVNCIAWWVARENNWKFDWIFQIVSSTGILGLGWIIHELVMMLNSNLNFNILIQIGVAVVVYGIMVGLFIWLFPWLTGFSRNDIKSMVTKTLKYIRTNR